MVDNLIILEAAEQDISAAYNWYELQEIGLGEEFLRCVDACVQGILRNPERWEIAYEEYHRAVIRRFPYVIFYEFFDDMIVIYSVFHCSQNPQKWRNRLP